MEDKKKNTCKVLRNTGMVITAILIVISIACFIRAYFLAAPVWELRKAMPIHMKVDVSKPGVYSSTIEHSEHKDYAHFGVISYLVHDSDITFPEITSTIEGKIETCDDQGNVITQFELYQESPPHQLGTDVIKGHPPCWVLSPFTAEQKTITITVTKPVESLENTEQIFEGYYLLNGMEIMPAGITFLFGFVFLGVSLLIVLIIILVPVLRQLPVCCI